MAEDPSAPSTFSQSAADAAMEWDKELADFEVLQVLKEGYKETKDGKNLLQNIRDQAAPIVGRIGLNTSDDKGEQSGDRKQLAKWYDEIYYADDLPKFSYSTLNNFLAVWEILQGLSLREEE